MTRSKSLSQSEPPLAPRQTLPTMYDLPSEDPEEPGLPDEYHCYQPALLRQTFQPTTYPPENIFTGTDLNLYYDLHHPNWHKRPDWFAVVGVERLYDGWDLRLSYVLWQEQVSPFVVVELLSPGTEDEDLGRTVRKSKQPPTKWEVYEQILSVPYYIVFSRYTNELRIFRWLAGQYEEIALTDGYLPIPQLGLSLGLWQGSYEGIERIWLRWFTLEGEFILTPQEDVKVAENELEIAKLETEAAEQKAEAAEQKAAKLAAKLRELNIDPEEL